VRFVLSVPDCYSTDAEAREGRNYRNGELGWSGWGLWTLLIQRCEGLTVNLIKAMALDHAKEGIRVNCVCLGYSKLFS
jgi:hypothetical protein